jgi:hypothetical protein
MRKILSLIGAGAALGLFACLVAPDEPKSTTSAGLTCSANQRAFNGACRDLCTTNAQCASALKCMKVSPNESLCLDYAHCAHLGSDTVCSAVGSAGYPTPTAYGDYGYGYGYSGYGYSGYGYGGFACAGDAKWQTTTPVAGDPQCGEAHAVARCQPANGACTLVTGTAIDIAEP